MVGTNLSCDLLFSVWESTYGDFESRPKDTATGAWSQGGPCMWAPSLGSVCIKLQASKPKVTATKVSVLKEAWNFLHRQPGMGMALFSLLKQSVFRLFSRAADSHPLLWLMDF